MKLTLGKKPADINGILFLIGVQELGKGQQNFSKEILDKYKENFSGNAFVKKAYITSLKQLEAKLSSKLDSENNASFDREAALILTSVNGKNALELSNLFYETGIFEGVDPGFLFNFQL